MITENIANFQYKSLPDQIFHTIKRMILSGQLKGGERIPEMGIADDFGVSRTPIREALRKLEEYGLITIKPRKYAEVLKMDREEVLDLTMVRVELERLAIRLFVERSGADDLAMINKLASECEALVGQADIAGFYEKDSLFHLEIAKRAKNQFLYDSLVKLDAKVQLSRLVKPLNKTEIQSAIKEHHAILKALTSKKTGEAEKCMEQHIQNNL
jgi:GntR family transcriptional regulator, rspAB operon transcriptional repressor